MRNVFFIIALFCSSLCMAATVDTIPANNAAIEYTGRIDFANSLAPKFSYSGVSIRANFTGTSIAAILNDDTGQNYYNIILDGKMLDTIKVSIGKKTYKLAEGLDNTTHEIEIFKRTELTFGKTQFFGFVVDKGSALVAIVNKRDKLIEFIGNSITCGYGNEGVNGGVFGPTTENHYLTYAAITSRNFNARHLAVCRSGIGIYRNYNGPATGSTDCMTNLYTRTFLYDENPKYSFTDKPDLVCIDLGTNDFSVNGGDSASYVNNYFRLIDTIQTKYTKPDIICLLGPMLSNPTLANIRRYLKVIADSATHKENGNVYFFEMSAQTGDLGIAIDYHPTVAQHKRNAQELTDYIKTLKGWTVKPLVVNASVVSAKHIKVEFNTAIQDKTSNFSGFELYANGVSVVKSNVYIDSTNNKVIHILTQQSFNAGAKINLSYTPGKIESTDLIPVGTVNYYSIKNSLTETKINSGTTTKAGTLIKLTFNKDLKKNTLIEGLTITTKKGVQLVDSFAVANAILTLYLKAKLIAGDSLFVSYNGNGIYGIDDIVLSTFSNLVIKNASTYTSIAQNESDLITIYPNPNTTGIFNYSITKTAVATQNSLEVYNANGAKIFSQKIVQTEGQIDLGEKLTKGVYVFKLILGKSVITKSIIKI